MTRKFKFTEEYMKNLTEIEQQLTAHVAELKGKKAGMHSWKNSREDTPTDIQWREHVDKILDKAREEAMAIRDELRKLMGK